MEQENMMVLGHVMDYNNDNDNDNDNYNGTLGNEENTASDPDLLSVHASFILVNFQGLEAKDVKLDLGQQGNNDNNSNNKTSVLLQAFEDFLTTLLATQCPHDQDDPNVNCWEQDPEATYDSAYDPQTGRLCGSHAEYVRQIYCRELQRRPPVRGRDLEPRNVIENIILYRAQDSHCPVPMIAQGKGKIRLPSILAWHNAWRRYKMIARLLDGALFGTAAYSNTVSYHQIPGGGKAPLCQTIYAHYLLHLHDLMLVMYKQEIEAVYANITQTAIHNGMLQDSLSKVDPDSVYSVEGQGFQLMPTVHRHDQHPLEQNEKQKDTYHDDEIKHSSYHHLHERHLNKPCTRFLRGSTTS
jgi:hypothetical protein